MIDDADEHDQFSERVFAWRTRLLEVIVPNVEDEGHEAKALVNTLMLLICDILVYSKNPKEYVRSVQRFIEEDVMARGVADSKGKPVM